MWTPPRLTPLWLATHGVLGGGRPPAPTITSLSVATGPASGGTAVTITGTGFRAGDSVTFGGDAATSVVVVSSTSLTCVSPAHAAGAVDVVVTDPQGRSGTLAGAWTYEPVYARSYQVGGTDEYARKSGLAVTTPDAAGAFTLAYWVRPDSVDVSPQLDVELYGDGNNAIFMQREMAAGPPESCLLRPMVKIGGATKLGSAGQTVTVPGWSPGAWILVLVVRSAANLWGLHAAVPGGTWGSVTGSTSTSTITVARASIGKGPTALPAVASFFAAGTWRKDLKANGEGAAWLADPQAIPSGGRHLWTPALDTLPTLLDRGAAGGVDLTAEAYEAGDLAATYPVAA